jgi:predicted ATPase
LIRSTSAASAARRLTIETTLRGLDRAGVPDLVEGNRGDGRADLDLGIADLDRELMAETDVIRTPDQRLRVFISSALQELAAERQAVRDAVTRLRLVPVMFELGARPHPPRQIYRAYLAQCQVFVGVYWQSYGSVAPGEEVSGLEDEYLLSAGLPRLIYIKSPAPEREARLAALLARIRDDDVSYHTFSAPAELQGLVENDLAVLLTERFETARSPGEVAEASLAGALPVPLTPLVGRDREARAVGDLFLGEGVRLVTLTGPGGVGKSRLAVEVAGRLAPSFDDGVRFVELDPVKEAGLVVAAIAGGLGLRTSGGPLITDVTAYLRPRRLLLVLDNFEQVTEAAPLVADLLAAAPGVAALVTSRMVLRIGVEHEFPVPPLPVPEKGIGQTAGDLQQYASVRLFVERAQAATASFELTSRNAEAVAEICRRLDGLPLAIELAAARVRLLPPQALLARLDHRLTLLTVGPRDLPERQRTLRATLEWSFDLLSPGEQRLFACLGVFAGGFDLPAAEAVSGHAGADDPAGPDGAGEVVDSLASLVDASLVQSADFNGELRFALLGTIQEYALECLGDGAEWRAAHDRHAAYYLAVAESAEPRLRGAGQLAWLERLEIEHGNLAAAMSWLVDQDQIESAHHLGEMIWRFWWLHGHAEELLYYGEKILAKGEDLAPDELGYAQSGVGFALMASGDQARARTLFEQSLSLFREIQDKFGIALSAGALGHLAVLRHEYARAGELLDESLALQRELGNDESIALVYNFLGQIPLSQGDPERAAQLFAQGLDLSRRVPGRFPLLVSLYDLALSSQTRGDLTGAAELLKEGLTLAGEAGDEASVGYYLKRLAAVAALQGDAERAVVLLAAAGALLQAAGSGWLLAYVAPVSPDDDAPTALRSRLGETLFQQAWARGGAMGRHRAVGYALKEAT